VRYLAFHKPYDVLSQFTPEPGSRARALAEFVPVKGVYPVGRLDRDSEGLLLLTDDGALQHRLSDPRYQHPRTYWAQVEGAPADEALDALRRGVALKDYTTRPAAVRLLEPEPVLAPRLPPIRVRRSIPTAWLELTLTEGRNRQVRHMTAAVGLPTLRLLRVAIGELRLGDLAAGCWRDLTFGERAALRRW
jgi:23S rRNA pseudouridine2457 synthase